MAESVPRHSREPRQDQKSWNGHTVDQNLNEDWLNALNRLSIFNLISICEGHQRSRDPYGKLPHINLRIKPFLLTTVNQIFNNNLKGQLSGILGNLFDHSSYATEIHCKKKSRSLIDDLTVGIRCRKMKITDHLELLNVWFPETIMKIEEFDKTTNDIVGLSNTQKIPQIENTRNYRTVPVLCSVLMKKGRPCSRMTYNLNGICWQHGRELDTPYNAWSY
ncbi:MAG: hypothetical protein Q8M08_03150 [Bacteroidales bacterium]|nr:hypothetical protein [Bacteroidales bacterium]